MDILVLYNEYIDNTDNEVDDVIKINFLLYLSLCNHQVIHLILTK